MRMDRSPAAFSAHDFAVDRVDTGADVELDRESAPLNFFSKLAHSAASDGEGLVEEDDLSNPVLPLEELHLINNMFDAAEPQLLEYTCEQYPQCQGHPRVVTMVANGLRSVRQW